MLAKDPSIQVGSNIIEFGIWYTVNGVNSAG